MRTGKFSANEADRSVTRPFRPGLRGFAPDNSGGAVRGNTACSVQSMEIRDELSFSLLFHRVMNRLYCLNADPSFVSCTFTLPESGEESEALKFSGLLAGACREAGVCPGALYYSVSGAVTAPFASLFAGGSAGQASGAAGYDSVAAPGSAVVMAGHTGMAGAGILACREEARLTKRFTSGFVKEAQAFAGEISLSWAKNRAGVMVPAGEGGIYAALWELAERTGCGFDISLLSLPIRQETVEITEELGVNPYLLACDGAVLIVTDRPEELLEELHGEGREAAAVGQLTEGRAKILRRGDEVRYLDKPAQDELERRKGIQEVNE